MIVNQLEGGNFLSHDSQKMRCCNSGETQFKTQNTVQNTVQKHYGLLAVV